ncbi:MAG: hypothetical protein A3G81_05015 [Betaproteobacteria bacterium RIFCSPLOWO2_12_FULL_65_14]|nr:MAG: hypothetical protein A3G81_05015 [Betaproteobacteria bacterium RIFCSPLOWO2_12_FULL_65_14]
MLAEIQPRVGGERERFRLVERAAFQPGVRAWARLPGKRAPQHEDDIDAEVAPHARQQLLQKHSPPNGRTCFL